MSLDKFDSDTLADDIVSVPDQNEAGAAMDASIAIIIACTVIGAVIGHLVLGFVVGLGAAAGIAAHLLVRMRRAGS